MNKSIFLFKVSTVILIQRLILMEKRLGVIAILITEKSGVPKINSLLTDYSEIIYGRQGIPLRDKGVNVISLVVDGSTDQISALTGKIGRIKGVEVKSILTKFRENNNESDKK
jgi:putative iron-only hydrogenase system regulator